MRPTLWSMVLLLLTTASVTGCLGGDDGVPDHVVATGSDPLVMTAYAYDGSNVTASTGSIAVDVTESTGGGSVVGNATLGGAAYSFEFTSFVGDPASPFQKQGISHDFYEHGDSGNGNTDVPSMHLLSAGWGPVSVTVGGEPVLDPLTGLASLTGHFMLTDAGVWDDASNRVLNADGSGPYSPSDPGNARNVTDDLELHVQIRSDPSTPVTPDNTTTGSGQLAPNAAEARFPIEVPNALATLRVSVAVSAPADGLPVVPADVNVTLQDPSGAGLRSAQLGPQSGVSSVTWEGVAPTGPGTYNVVFTSQGAANWSVEALVDNPAPLFLYFVYENVTWGDGGE